MLFPYVGLMEILVELLEDGEPVGYLSRKELLCRRTAYLGLWYLELVERKLGWSPMMVLRPLVALA